jgi:hypothetical protein
MLRRFIASGRFSMPKIPLVEDAVCGAGPKGRSLFGDLIVWVIEEDSANMEKTKG